MSKPRKSALNAPSPPAPPHQMPIAFESIRLRGMSASERMKVLMHLANLIMQAAGVAAKECDDER